MRRREFLGVVGGAATWSLGAAAQTPTTTKRVGVLIPAQGEARLQAVRKRLASLGWLETKNLQIIARLTESNPDEIKAYANELLQLRPDVILAGSSAVVATLLGSSHSIPIVFAAVADPVGSGFVQSLARPGGRVTGFLVYEQSLGGKWLQILNEVAPNTKRIAALYHPPTSPRAGAFHLPAFEANARALGLKSLPLPVQTIADIDTAFASLSGGEPTGIVVLPSPFAFSSVRAIATSALQYRLPTVSPYRESVLAGGLASYGADLMREFEQAAGYVARILDGQSPAELPIQQPTKFDFFVNIKTAKLFGIELSPMILGRADGVIE